MMCSLRPLLILGVSCPCLFAQPAPEPVAPTTPNRAQLVAVIAGSDRLVVTAPSPNTNEQQVLFELSDASKIVELAEALDIDDQSEAFHDMCYGDAWLHFYSGERKRATVSFHHASILRWIDGPWASDAMLQNGSGERLTQWFAAQGFSALETERQNDIEQERARRDEVGRLERHLPAYFIEVLVANRDRGFDGEERCARQVIAASPDKVALTLELFRAFRELPPHSNGYTGMMGESARLLSPTLKRPTF